MADPSEMLIHSNQSFPEGYFCCNPSLFISQPAKAPYFVNTPWASSGMPSAEEVALLSPFREDLPAALFTSIYTLPTTDGSGNYREHLNQARKLLLQAGFTYKKHRLINPDTGKPLTLEVVNDSPGIEATLLTYKSNLDRLGIELKIKTIDSSQYIERIRRFDFDLANWWLGHERIPGTEMYSDFGSEGAHEKSSENIVGIQHLAVDSLIGETEKARTVQELQPVLHALDRVLLWGHYVVPKWYSHKGQRVAYHKALQYPKTEDLYWFDASTWWYEPEVKPKH